MQAIANRRIHPELREVVVEAAIALARLDADRLEELTLSCQALNRDLTSDERRAVIERDAREALHEMNVFERVLDATRANLEVMNRVRDRRSRRLEYDGRFLTGWGAWGTPERKDGHD